MCGGNIIYVYSPYEKTITTTKLLRQQMHLRNIREFEL